MTIQLYRTSAMQVGRVTSNKSFSGVLAPAYVRIKHLKQYLMVTEMIFRPFFPVQ